MATTGDPLNIDVTTSTGVRIRFNNWAEQILIEAPEGHELYTSFVNLGTVALQVR